MNLRKQNILYEMNLDLILFVKKNIQGIVIVINISIFLISTIFLTKHRSFSWETGNQVDYFFSMAISKDWLG